MPFHSGPGGLFDSAFELIGGVLGGAVGGPVGAAVGARLGGAIINGQSTSTAPIAPNRGFPAGPSILGSPTFAPPIQAGFDFAPAPVVREVGRIVGPAIARELGQRFLGDRGGLPAVTNGSTVAVPRMGTGVVCKPVSEREIILMQARAHSPGATARKIVLAAKACGMDVAAGMHGLSVRDVCFLVINMPRRRAKGISARDMRTTNRTLRGIDRVRKNAKRALTGK